MLKRAPRGFKSSPRGSQEGSRALQEGLKRSKEVSRGLQELSKSVPRGLQAAKTAPRARQEAPGSILEPSGEPIWTLKISKIAIFGTSFPCFEGSRKTSKSIPRYAKTRLFCQERAKIFQDKPLKASLLERKPRSLQERIPQRARAGLGGVGGGATPHGVLD